MKLNPRQKAEKSEELLSPLAVSSAQTRGRQTEEALSPTSTAFQLDCQRIVQSKAFRRLRGKTQVFLWPEGDHYRTRLTHCQEVSQIARTLARALDLNEDLVEAISLSHDLGHTPFGHAGEEVMQRLLPKGFRHAQQSLRVVERLENDGRGLNLTFEVRDGILHHSKGAGPLIPELNENLPRTLEGQVVRVADVVAYVNHDLDDALRAQVISPAELPQEALAVLGTTHSERVTTLVLDIADQTDFEAAPIVRMSDEKLHALEAQRAFMFEYVYHNPKVHAEFDKATTLIEQLWHHFMADLDRFYRDFWPSALKDGEPVEDVRDFVAGMTDAFAVNLHERIFIPRRWYIL